MGKRADLISRLNDLVGKDYVAFGGFKMRPDKTPYITLSEGVPDYLWADDRLYLKCRGYAVRLVTTAKSFGLEDQMEEIFDSLGFVFAKRADEEVSTEKAYVVEWNLYGYGKD
jgi:hypothetical protein